MSFGVADLITVAILRERLIFLSKHPDYIEFMLLPFIVNKGLEELVGRQYIAQAVEFIMNNRIMVAPYYELEPKIRPAIAVVASGNEEQQFLGDEGFSCPTAIVQPRVYATFDALSISEDGMVISVPLAYDLQSKLWPGLYVKNGSIVRMIRGLAVKETQVDIYVTESISAGTPIKGWVAQSAETVKGYHINESVDRVRIQCKLQTTGDYSVHRLLSIVVRYCLKSSRLLFDSMGVQVATFSYTPPMPSEMTEMEFETVYTIEGLLKESWVIAEFQTPDYVQVEAAVTPDIETEEGDDSVVLVE
jgi:hypothetical protein